jgi:hypothetical protein
MRYFNQDDVNYNSRGIAEESVLLESRGFSKVSSSVRVDVFLAHSSDDKKSLPAVIKFLEGYGVKVYIDKRDPRLPKRTSKETAEMLKDQIKRSRKFIVLVSENSKDSKWVPWELGISDNEKTVQNIALLPLDLIQAKPEWPEQEYLGLYHRITNGALDGYAKPIWMVYNQDDNTAAELGQWLKRV